MSETTSTVSVSSEPARPETGGGFTAKRRGDHLNVPRTEILEGIKRYSQRDQDDLLWLHGYTLDVLHGSRSALVAWMGVDWSTITKIWTGRYEAEPTKFLERVRHLRRRAERVGDTTFVETEVTKRVWALCDIAKVQNAIVMLVGPSGRGKSEPLKEWKRRTNHGSSLYVDCPESGGLRALLDEIAKAAGVGQGKPNHELTGVLMRSFDYRHTIILDEVARLLPTRSANITALEFLRRLHDVRGCGLVLVCTDVFPKAMKSGALDKWFQQLAGRIEATLTLPERVSRSEVAEICSAFCTNSDPSADLIAMALDVARSDGRMRRLFWALRTAVRMAEEKGEALAAGHLEATLAFRNRTLSLPEDRDEPRG
jgi:DNA transposition AAA+ family ATPase